MSGPTLASPRKKGRTNTLRQNTRSISAARMWSLRGLLLRMAPRWGQRVKGRYQHSILENVHSALALPCTTATTVANDL